VRERSRWVVAFGDCAVSANVPGMRNLLEGADAVLRRGYLELADHGAQLPRAPGIVPELLDRVRPLHEVIPVDLWLPGCPPSAERIKEALIPLLAGQLPRLEGEEMLRFG
jgi:NAD-reducing hydrogenase small subunit